MSEHHIKGMTENPRPTNLVLHQKSQVLEILFDDGSQFNLPCEYLRVYSPSAAVKGHGPGQEVLQYGKQNVGIDRIEPQGAYAVKLCFDDGHDTGLYRGNCFINSVLIMRSCGRTTCAAWKRQDANEAPRPVIYR